MINYTAHSRAQSTVLGYGSQTHSYADICSTETERRRLLAFCGGNCIGDKSLYVYRVKALGTVKKPRNVSKTETHCATCGYALFWTRNYVCMTETEVKEAEFARKMTGLPSMFEQKKARK